MNLWTAPAKAFRDARGEFVELYRERDWVPRFVEDDISINHRGVLRGIHGDGKTWKLVTCLWGEVYFVAVRPSSMTYSPMTLSSGNHAQVLVPPRYGVGYQALTEPAIVHYKQSQEYGTSEQFTIRYDDPRLKIPWPIENPILSDRDRNAKEVK